MQQIFPNRSCVAAVCCLGYGHAEVDAEHTAEHLRNRMRDYRQDFTVDQRFLLNWCARGEGKNGKWPSPSASGASISAVNILLYKFIETRVMSVLCEGLKLRSADEGIR